MRPIHEISGRLGNQMFQLAFCYAKAKEMGTDHYFQDPKYFEKYANEIKSLFGDLTWTGEPMNDFVSIHVRRGDYVGNGFYVDLMQTDYYQRAMAEFPDRQFLVFTDDYDWCLKNFMKGVNNIAFSDEADEIRDLNKMLHCNGHICANSTFSFWGAWLGKGKVVCPDEESYYTDKVVRTVFPKNWTRIKV